MNFVSRVLALVLLLSPLTGFGDPIADKVLVIKSEHALYLMKDGEAFAAFHVVFGDNPEGHKQQQGMNVHRKANIRWGIKTVTASTTSQSIFPTRTQRTAPGQNSAVSGPAAISWSMASPTVRHG